MISIYKSSNNILYYSLLSGPGIILFSALLRLKVPEVFP